MTEDMRRNGETSEVIEPCHDFPAVRDETMSRNNSNNNNKNNIETGDKKGENTTTPFRVRKMEVEAWRVMAISEDERSSVGIFLFFLLN